MRMQRVCRDERNTSRTSASPSKGNGFELTELMKCKSFPSARSGKGAEVSRRKTGKTDITRTSSG